MCDKCKDTSTIIKLWGETIHYHNLIINKLVMGRWVSYASGVIDYRCR
jgi:hypothetical protein